KSSCRARTPKSRLRSAARAVGSGMARYSLLRCRRAGPGAVDCVGRRIYCNRLGDCQRGKSKPAVSGVSGLKAMTRLFGYVGPADIRDRVAGRPAGTRISSVADLLAWVRATGQRAGPDGLVAVTFVIDEQGDLLLADRRSEHVACAGGGPVRA